MADGLFADLRRGARAGGLRRHHDLFQSEAQRREGDSEVLDVCREDQFPFDGAVSEERHIIGDGAAFELVEFECALLVGHYADRIVDHERGQRHGFSRFGIHHLSRNGVEGRIAFLGMGIVYGKEEQCAQEAEGAYHRLDSFVCRQIYADFNDFANLSPPNISCNPHKQVFFCAFGASERLSGRFRSIVGRLRRGVYILLIKKSADRSGN